MDDYDNPKRKKSCVGHQL